MKGQLVIKRVQWQQREGDLKRLRQEIFVDEQGVRPEEEWDGRDPQAAHFLAFINDTPVACARLQPSGKIERMGVVAPLRRQGIGRALLKGVVAFAKEQALPEIYLDAQTHALGFYKSLGFVAQGEEFKEAGILHRRMYLQGVDDQPEYATDTHSLSGPHESLQALKTYLAAGRYAVDILSDQLTPALFSDEAVVAAVTDLARRSPRSRVRILVKDSRPLQSHQHDLVLLAQRLPSRVTVRAFSPDIEPPAASYTVVDQRAVVYFNSEARFSGFTRREARAEARRLGEEFERLWEHCSFIDPNLKQLHL